LKTFLLSFGLLLTGLWALMPEYVRDRHTVAAAGVGLLACWLGLSTYGGRRRRRLEGIRAVQSRVMEDVSADLAAARLLLPAAAAGVSQLDELLLRGDFRDAVGVMESLGVAHEAPPEYWESLASAARRMGADDAEPLAAADRGLGSDS
jgi:hypothetical protein